MTAARRPVLIVVWALLVAVAGVVAAVSHDDDKLSTGAATSTTTRAAALGASGGPAPGASSDAAAVGSPDATSNGTSTADAGGGGTPTDGGGGTADPGTTPAARTMPLPGTYTMATQSGSHATFNGSPQTVPDQSQLVIEQLSDTDQRLTSPSGAGDLVTQVRYSPSEVDLVSMQLGPKAFQPNPPATFAMTGAPQGTTWQWTCISTDGQTTLAAQGQMAGTETVTIGDQAVDTEIVDLVLTLSGDVVGTAHMTLWVRKGDRLPVRQHMVTDVSDSSRLLYHLQSDVTSQLVALTPT